MTETVYKYPIPVQDRFSLLLPADAEPLYVGMQGDVPMLWVRLNPHQLRSERFFHVVGTGHTREVGVLGAYVGTFRPGPLVFHVFSEVEHTPEIDA